MSLFGPPNIHQLQSKNNSKGLIRALNYKPSAIFREKAAEALGEMKCTDAVPRLIKTLNDESTNVKRACITALAKIGDPAAVKPVIDCYMKEDFYVPLGNFGEPGIKGLNAYLDHNGDIEAAKKIAIALGDFRHIDAVQSLINIIREYGRNVQDEVARSLNQTGKIAIPLLASALIYKKSRQVAAKTLHNLNWKYSRSTEGAYYCIEYEKWDECVKMGTAAIKPLIENFSEHTFTNVLNSIIKIGRPAIDYLIPALKDENPVVRKGAVAALKVLGIANTAKIRRAEKSFRNIAETERDWNTRAAAAQLLNDFNLNLGTPEVAAVYWISKQYWNECAKLGENAIQPLFHYLTTGDEHDEAIIATIATIGEPALNHLLNYLTYANDRVRQVAALALGKLNDAQAVKPLTTVFINDQTEDVRIAAARALSGLGWQPPDNEFGALFDIYNEKWDDCVKRGEYSINPLINMLKNNPASAKAIETLAKIGRPVIKHLMVLLNNSQIENSEKDYKRNHKIAVDVLTKIKDDFATGILVRVLKDKNKSMHLREYVANFLSKKGWGSENDADMALLWILNKEFPNIERLKYSAVKNVLIQSLDWNLNWQSHGEIASILVKNGIKLTDPRISKVMTLLKMCAAMPDCKVENIYEINQDARKIEIIKTVSKDKERAEAAALLKKIKTSATRNPIPAPFNNSA